MQQSIALIGLCLVLSAPAQLASSDTSAREQAVRTFFRLREQMLGERGSPADVDALLALFAPGASYEHPAAGVRMTLDEARRGMLAHLGEGREVQLIIVRVLRGTTFVAVETTLAYNVQRDGKEQHINRSGIALFEFQGARISRVAEY
jgi:ketosteroid isomerase-like protein